MSDLSVGNHADVVLNAGDVLRVSTGGVATVVVAYGAPAGTTTITANTQDFGPYSVPAKLAVNALTGTTSYANVAAYPVVKMPDGTLQAGGSPVDGAGNISAPKAFGAQMRKAVFIGASITGAANAGGPANTYTWVADQIVDWLRIATPTTIYPYPGATPATIFGNIANILSVEKPNLVILGPDFGTNSTRLCTTYQDTATNYGQYVQAVKELCDKLGIALIVCSTLPRGDGRTAGTAAGAGWQCFWLSLYSQQTGLTVIDCHAPMIDPRTGYMPTSYWTAPDETHPIQAGHAALGSLIGAGLNATPATGLSRLLCPVTAFGGGKVGNPLMFGTLGNPTGYVNRAPESWTSTRDTVAPSNYADLPVGWWWTIQATPTGAGTVLRGTPSFTVATGDVVLIFAYGKAEGAAVFRVELTNTDTNAALTSVVKPVNGGPSVGALRRYVIPAGVTNVGISARLSASGAVATSKGYMGAAQLWNLTELGVA